MTLSAPIHRLKHRAKLMAREDNVPLHSALDQLAVEEGFQSWSHLAAHTETRAQGILKQLAPGEMLLLGARPQQGKTLLGLELAAEASHIGRRGYVFTLDYHDGDIAERFDRLGIDGRALQVDTSDDISAAYIMARVKGEALIVVDYLQLLDQKRSNPSLQAQVSALKGFAQETGAVCVLISQIDRGFDLSGRDMPGLLDVRLLT